MRRRGVVQAWVGQNVTFLDGRLTAASIALYERLFVARAVPTRTKLTLDDLLRPTFATTTVFKAVPTDRFGHAYRHPHRVRVHSPLAAHHHVVKHRPPRAS